ncbi:pseudaminic acid synthase [Lachnospiraceae bacterium 3-1]|nr:pseudaminic acid synthase [Lachnospiraceae bacterium 3-1]
MEKFVTIGGKRIGAGYPAFLVAEMSANHNMDFDRAKEIIRAAKLAGADAVKLQTYTADTITIDCENSYFQINQGTLWDGTTLHKLYESAYTPWEWQKELKDYAETLGLVCFSSPFDETAVDFLEEMDMPAYKIASFEITDIPLIRKVARLGKPIIISTGIAYLEDIDLAVRTCLEENNTQIILLKCTSAYPAKPESMNLRTIASLEETFHCVPGLSDHSMGSTAAIAGVAVGAKMIEKHLTLKREDGGPDALFSMEAEEFKDMCTQIRIAEQALGMVHYGLTMEQSREREHSRSLFAVQDIAKGERLTKENIRSIRPGFGMHPRYYEEILGKVARKEIRKGEPMHWGLIE